MLYPVIDIGSNTVKIAVLDDENQALTESQVSDNGLDDTTEDTSTPTEPVSGDSVDHQEDLSIPIIPVIVGGVVIVVAIVVLIALNKKKKVRYPMSRMKIFLQSNLHRITR